MVNIQDNYGSCTEIVDIKNKGFISRTYNLFGFSLESVINIVSTVIGLVWHPDLLFLNVGVYVICCRLYHVHNSTMA